MLLNSSSSEIIMKDTMCKNVIYSDIFNIRCFFNS